MSARGRSQPFLPREKLGVKFAVSRQAIRRPSGLVEDDVEDACDWRFRRREPMTLLEQDVAERIGPPTTTPLRS